MVVFMTILADPWWLAAVLLCLLVLEMDHSRRLASALRGLTRALSLRP